MGECVWVHEWMWLCACVYVTVGVGALCVCVECVHGFVRARVWLRECRVFFKLVRHNSWTFLVQAYIFAPKRGSWRYFLGQAITRSARSITGSSYLFKLVQHNSWSFRIEAYFFTDTRVVTLLSGSNDHQGYAVTQSVRRRRRSEPIGLFVGCLKAQLHK